MTSINFVHQAREKIDARYLKLLTHWRSLLPSSSTDADLDHRGPTLKHTDFFVSHWTEQNSNKYLTFAEGQ